MLKKLFFFSLAIVGLLIFSNMSNNQDPQHRVFTFNHRVGDALGSDVVPNVPITGNVPVTNNEPLQGPITYHTDAVNFTVSEVSLSARTKYDLQSNAMIHYIQQDPADKRKLHACWMFDDIFAAGFPDRRSKYYYSNDTGNTWTFLSQVPDGIRSGFPGITLLSSGIPVIANHNVDGGGLLRTQLYNDASVGAGFFNRLDPVQPNSIWPSLVATSNVTLTNKVAFVSSVNAASPGDSAYRNVCTSITGTGSFLGYVFVPEMTNANEYALARGIDGRIGCAFASRSPIPDGSVMFMESTNNGTSWTTPTAIYTPNFTTDSLANYRGLDITYKGTTPIIVFGVTVWEPTAGGYYPNRPGKLYSYSPGVNGGLPVTIATHPGLTGITQGFLDGFTPVCRPTIGTSGNGDAVYCVYNYGRPDTNSVGDNYFDVYITWSASGAVWSTPTRLTNITGPLRDCRYVSISDQNHVATNGAHFAHVLFQQDSVPGSAVNGAGISLARMMYAKVNFFGETIGIHNTGGEVPKTYSLHQNYPNPFNPTTKIRFELPQSSKVTLNLYDVTGKVVDVLINEFVSAGVQEFEYDASNLPSGIYFYTLTAGKFTDSKKMVLVK